MPWVSMRYVISSASPIRPFNAQVSSRIAHTCSGRGRTPSWNGGGGAAPASRNYRIVSRLSLQREKQEAGNAGHRPHERTGRLSWCPDPGVTDLALSRGKMSPGAQTLGVGRNRAVASSCLECSSPRHGHACPVWKTRVCCGTVLSYRLRFAKGRHLSSATRSDLQSGSD